MHFLLHWNLLRCSSICLFFLSRRKLHFNCILIKLYELFRGLVRRIGGNDCMQCVHCGVLLRYDGAIRSDRQLRCWELFDCFSIRLLALPRRYLCCFSWVSFVQHLSCWVVLRFSRTFG